jgi:rubrerythrin
MKKTKKELEQEMIAQMEEALQEQKAAQEQAQADGEEPTKETPQFHCRKCKTLMENGKCPACGYTDYVPMDAKTQRKVRLILGGICVLAFIILFFATR